VKYSGTDGAVILGTTGESTTISLEERTELIKLAVKTLKGKMPIIVGTGTIDPNKVIELSQHALELGADAHLVITPYYGNDRDINNNSIIFLSLFLFFRFFLI
jgi:4-hydroxy-tetrahydrodipicolinate synthase